MPWIGIFVGGCGLFFTLTCPSTLDNALLALWKRTKAWLERMLSSSPLPHADLLLTGRLISSLRAGISLDSALESAALEAAPGSEDRARLRRILDGSEGGDFLSEFLRTSIKTGAPALASLQGFEKAFMAKRRLQLKARATTGQCRAQAEVLSWLPWLMALAIMIIDKNWFRVAMANPISWLFWGIALLLSGFGRQWISKALQTALSPRSETERLEEEVIPDFALRIISELAQGRDAESACESALLSQNCSLLSRQFTQEKVAIKPESLARMIALLRRSAATGAPLRDDLLAFLQDLYCETEARWEERVQRLPVMLLGPLFICFFPSSLLVLAGLLIPLFQEVL